MRIKEVIARTARDSRKDKTIEISIKTKLGLFLSSSPSGKSKGENEKASYIKNVEDDIKRIINLSENFSEIDFEEFKDLEKIELLVKEKIGANTLFALESCLLKAVAAEQGISLWELINEKARKIPFPVGNCIGGGLHSKGKKPDFQEFLIIPKTENFSDNFFLMKEAWKICGKELEVRKALVGKSDENAHATSLNNEQVLGIIKKVKEEMEDNIGKKIEIGVDIAASSFYTGFLYNYENEKKRRKREEQIQYILDLIDKHDLEYIEDPLQEEDFSGFSVLKKESIKTNPKSLIVGDDLITSQAERLKRAIREKSVNAIILKPNQVGSLLEIAKINKLAKKYGIKTIMSHRSGETLDYSLADLAFGFSCDYIKTGIKGMEREVKLKRMIEIEKSL